MPSRAFRRAVQKKGDNVSDIIEKRHETHPLRFAFTVVVLVLIIITFIISFGGPLRAGPGATGSIVFGSYNGHDIAYYPGSYFAQQRDTIANQLRSNSQQSQQEQTQTIQTVWYQAYLSTVQHVALLDIANAAGVVVTEDAVDKALLHYPAYLDENGNFSESRYNAVSTSDRAATRRLTREDLIQSVVVGDLSTGVRQGTKESQFIASMATPERSFSFVSFPFSSFPADEVRKYGEANTSRFVKIKLSRILVKSSQSEAEQIRRKIVDRTSTFEELAKTYSGDTYADKGGDMGWRYAYDLETDFEAKDMAQKVLALKAGDLSDVVKGTFGWMVYRCDSEAVAPDFSSSAVLDDVRKYLSSYEKGKIEDYFTTRATQVQHRADAVGLDAAAREAKVSVATLKPFPVNLSNTFDFAQLAAVPDSALPPNAPYSEDFFYRAFSLGKDQVSAPIILDDQVLLLKLKSEEPLPESTTAVMTGWLAYRASQSLQSDLGATLMSPDKLKDDFVTAFTTYIMPNAPAARQ